MKIDEVPESFEHAKALILNSNGTEDHVNELRLDITKTMQEHGATKEILDDYFNKKDTVTPAIDINLKLYEQEFKEQAEKKNIEFKQRYGDKARESDGLLETIEGTYQGSLIGMYSRGELPELINEDSSTFEKIASGITDIGLRSAVALPAAGLLTIARVPGQVGIPGGYALEAGARQWYAEGLAGGSIENVGQFLDRLGSASKAAGTDFAVNVAAMGAGQLATKAIGPMIEKSASFLSKNAAKSPMLQKAIIGSVGAGKYSSRVAAEVGAMTAVHSALTKTTPTMQDFVDGALLMTTIHAAGVPSSFIKNRMITLYGKTGMTVADMVQKSNTDPVFREGLFGRSQIFDMFGNKILDFDNNDPFTGLAGAWDYNRGVDGKTVTYDTANLKTPPVVQDVFLTPQEAIALRIGKNKTQDQRAKQEVTREPIETQFYQNFFDSLYGFQVFKKRLSKMGEFVIEKGDPILDENGKQVKGKYWGKIDAEKEGWVEYIMREPDKGSWKYPVPEQDPYMFAATLQKRTEGIVQHFLKFGPVRPDGSPMFEGNKLSIEGILDNVDRAELKNYMISKRAINISKEMNITWPELNNALSKGTGLYEKITKEGFDLQKYADEAGLQDGLSFKDKKAAEKKAIELFAKDVEKNNFNFDAFLVKNGADRGIKKGGFHKEPGVDLIEAEKLVADIESGRSDISSKATILSEIFNSIRKFKQEHELISKDAVYKDNYVPFHRVFKSDGKGGIKLHDHKLEGSTKNVVDPLQSLYEDLATGIRASLENKMLNIVIDAAEKHPQGKLILEKVNGAERITAAENKMKSDLVEFGIDPDAFDTQMWVKEGLVLGDNEVVRHRDGKPEIYKINQKTLFNSISDITKGYQIENKVLSALVKIASIQPQVLKKSLQLTPEYWMSNFKIDNTVATLLSKDGIFYPAYALDSMSHLFGKKSILYQNYLVSGSAKSGFLRSFEEFGKTDWYKYMESTNAWDRARHVFRNAEEAGLYFSDIAEGATRLTAFRSLNPRMETSLKIPLEDRIASAYYSYESSINFGRSGMLIKQTHLNKMFAFLNVGIQGPDRFARAIKDDPGGMAARTTMMAIGSVVLKNQQDNDPIFKKYMELNANKEEERHFWHFPIHAFREVAPGEDVSDYPFEFKMIKDGTLHVWDGHVVRVKKGFEGAVVGTTAEILFEGMKNDSPDMYKDIIHNLYQSIYGETNTEPTALRTYNEIKYNTNNYTKAPIVPYSLTKELPRDRWLPATTESAKVLYEILATIGIASPDDIESNISPITIEYGIRSTFTDAGLAILKTLDAVAFNDSGYIDSIKKSEIDLDSNIFVKRFFLQNNSRAIIDKFEKLALSEDILKRQIKRLRDSGDEAGADRILESSGGILYNHKDLSFQMKTANKAIQVISKDKELTDVVKRQSIEAILYKKAAIAKEGLDRFEEISNERQKINVDKVLFDTRK